jgi:tetratricopeptide (TPR) repeat protein
MVGRRFACLFSCLRLNWVVLGVVAIAVAAGESQAVAQMNMAGHDMGPMTEVPSPEKLPVPVKMTGIGNSYLAIKATPEAQMWFTQGLNLMHDFWGYEAERAFEQAVRVDPKCAMCYWGLYQSLPEKYGRRSVYADQALASAVKLENQASKAEQLYIEAAVARNDAIKAAAPGAQPDFSNEVAVWRRLVKESPDDLQAKIFLAIRLDDDYDAAGEPKKGTKEEIALLQEVMKARPDDSAANHYWIHAVEASSKPEQALGSATLLASLAPASGHMVHMPGHIFYRVGDYAQAEHWFAASTAVDESYMRAQHVEVDNDWNYIHNLMYGVANLMEEGKLAQATELSGKLAGGRGQLAQTLNMGVARDGITRVVPELPVALRTGDWAAVLKMLDGAKPADKLENLKFLAGQLKEFARGMQALETGDLAAAQTASDRLDAQLWRLSQRVKDAPKKQPAPPGVPFMAEVLPDATARAVLSNLSIMSLELRGTILAEQKKLTEAKALFAEGAQEEKAIGYNEPPGYIRPVAEAEGVALLRAGDFAGAHKAYETALAERPNSGFPLFGMARSSEAAWDTVAAGTEYAKFAVMWKDADAGMPQMEHAREYIAGEKTVASTAEGAK